MYFLDKSSKFYYYQELHCYVFIKITQLNWLENRSECALLISSAKQGFRIKSYIGCLLLS